MMRWRIGTVLVAVAAAACGDGTARIPEHDLFVSASCAVDSVEFGRAFAVDVVRVWRRDLEPEPWTEDSLAPLTVELVARERRQDDARIEETMHLRARAFAAGDLTVVPVLRATGGGGDGLVAEGEPLRLRVTAALAPDADAEVAELPGGLLPVPSGAARWPLPLALLAAAGLVAWAAARRRRRRAPPAPVAPAAPAGPDPAAVALARLRALRGAAPHGREPWRTFCVEASAAVRDYLEGGLGLHAPRRTSDELLAESYQLGDAPRRHLARLLAACDLVKFARHLPGDEAADDLLTHAEAVIESTRNGDGHGEGVGS